MATTPIQYNTYNPGMNYSSSDPRQIAKNNLQSIASQGQQLYNQNNQMLNQGQQQLQGTQGYLNTVEDPLAQGQGGYNQQEVSQIEMTPQQQQDIVTGAGISAGANTAAATDAANRQFNATGGNPAAMAAYRQREAQQQGSQAANALTGARIGAQQALSGETQAVGNARLAQQNQGLGYYQQLQNQQNQNVQNAAERNQQTYGTATGGGNGATATGIGASQTPSTFDKTISAIGSFLEDGGELTPPNITESLPQPPPQYSPTAPWQAANNRTTRTRVDLTQSGHGVYRRPPVTRQAPPSGEEQSYAPESYADRFKADGTPGDGGDELGHQVVVAEGNNPERIVAGNYRQMSSQGTPGMAEDGDAGDSGWSDSSGMTPDVSANAGATPWWQKLGEAIKGQAGTTPMGASSTGNKMQQPAWNPTTPYQQLGSGIGKAAAAFGFLSDGGIMPSFSEDGTYLEQGGMEEIHPPTHGYGPGRSYGGGMPQGANGIFTKPTRVNLSPGDKVVPLTYRPHAKVRTSAAFGPSGVRM